MIPTTMRLEARVWRGASDEQPGKMVGRTSPAPVTFRKLRRLQERDFCGRDDLGRIIWLCFKCVEISECANRCNTPNVIRGNHATVTHFCSRAAEYIASMAVTRAAASPGDTSGSSFAPATASRNWCIGALPPGGNSV